MYILVKALWQGRTISFVLEATRSAGVFVMISIREWIKLVGLKSSPVVSAPFFGTRIILAELMSYRSMHHMS